MYNLYQINHIKFKNIYHENLHMQTDVEHKPCNHKAILILAVFTRHFDPYSKKETARNKS